MKCKLCGSSKIKTFLQLGRQPLANKYPTLEQFATEEFHELNINFCTECKTVQLDQIVDRSKMFTDYYYLSSVNKPLVTHFEELAVMIAESKPHFVIDIGSNDGILLKPLKALGVDSIGVEPSVNVSKIANDKGLITINSFFNQQAVDFIKQKYQKADFVVASSVFTHLENPHDFIEAVKNVMTSDGMFIVEVEYIKNIIENIQFERFYFDRIFYYSLTSLNKLFQAHGMRIVDADVVDMHGGSLRVTVVKESSNLHFTPRYIELLNGENALNIELLSEFASLCVSAMNEFKNELTIFKERGLKVAGYGVPARVATITNFGGIDKHLIEYLVDDSPLKIGKYSPGEHIPIYDRQHLIDNPVDVLIVFAYEYADDIKSKSAGLTKVYIRPIPFGEL